MRLGFVPLTEEQASESQQEVDADRPARPSPSLRLRRAG